jgi:hypothetical protein
VPFLRAILKKLLNDINVGFIIKVEQFKKKIPREISSVSKYEKGEKYERHKNRISFNRACVLCILFA